jgi:predicted nucleotide-binding protein
MTEYPEKYWHCHVAVLCEGQVLNGSQFNMTFAELQKGIVLPYRKKTHFVVGRVNISDISKIAYIKIERTTRPINTATGERIEFVFHDYATELLNAGISNGGSTAVSAHGSSVFVVDGRDDALRSEVCRVVERLGLHPVVLLEQADEGRTIIEKFEDHSDVGYAVVLIAPDDEGRLRGTLELAPRARQNVIFELGFFYGKLGRKKVCAILKEGVEFPSDISGVIYKTADATGAWKLELAKEMKAAGLDVDLNKLG